MESEMGGMLDGRTIIVTGGGGGIGSCTARLLAKAGAKIVVSDITDSGRAVAAEITSFGGEAHFIAGDLAIEADVKALVDGAVARFGKLDGAFNNAGIEQHALPIFELSKEQWDKVIRINLTGMFLCLKYQILAMKETGGGAIVNTSSGLGQVALPGAAEYIASKHGVVGLTRAAAVDCRALGIRVNSILPGVVNTPMISRLVDDPALVPMFDALRARHPLNRFAEPSEIGETVKWLLSDAASFVTGAAIAVDGGYLAT